MIRRQVIVPAAPERVWEFLTDPGALGPWLGGRLDWLPTAGGQITFQGEDGAIREGVVEDIRSDRYVRFTWWPTGTGGGPPSEVAFLLEATSGGTRLTVTERVVDEEGPLSWPIAEGPASRPLRQASPLPPGSSAGPWEEPSPPASSAPVPSHRAGRWGAGDEALLSSWVRAGGLCQVG